MANAFKVGEIEVLGLSDGHIKMSGPAYFNRPLEEWGEHERRWVDHEGTVIFPLGCFLVRSGGQTVLIDTGLGPIKFGPYEGGMLFDDLASAGVRPEDVDSVFVTHLHADHCGTIARKAGDVIEPAFQKAAYRWTSAEESHWRGPQPEGAVVRRDLMDAVAARYQPVEDGASLAPGVTVISLPGHTPGHAGVVLSSGTERAFILGDAISCPVQLEQSEWSGMGDIDPKLARQSQEAVAKEAEGTGALVGASHFPGLTLGRVLRGEGRRYWQPV